VHARRKFFQAVELNPQDQIALRILARMDELFQIDAQAREQALSQEDRQLLRLEKSKLLLDDIKTQIQAARSCALPKSVLAKACNYTLTLWTRLIPIPRTSRAGVE
jgi:transposase